MSGVYSGETKRVAVTMHVEVTHDGPNDFLNRTVAAWLRQQAEEELAGRPYTIVADSVQLNATSRTQANVESDGTLTGDPGNNSAGFAAPTPGQSSGSRPGMGGMGLGQPAGGGGGMGMGGQGRRARGAGRQAPGAGLGGNTAPAGGQAAAPAGGALGGSVGSVLQETLAATRIHRTRPKSERQRSSKTCLANRACSSSQRNNVLHLPGYL